MRRVPSPCIQRCALDPSGAACQGCGRTMGEIRAWTRLSDVERTAVLDRLAGRNAPPAPAPDRPIERPAAG